MSPDSIPQLSLGTAVLLIFALCAGFMFLRGMTRLVVGTVVLSVSAWVGFRVWQAAPTLSVEWTGKSQAWMTHVVPVVVFLVCFFLLRRITKAVASPFGKSEEGGRSLIGTAFRLLLALVPTSLICLIGATLVHHAGSIAEVKAYSQKTNGGNQAPAGFSQRMKSVVEAAVPEGLLKMLDPLTDPSRLNLAKLVARQADDSPEPVIDPRTGKPIPRAIIVDDPELQNLARDGKFGTLLRHPLLTKAMADPKLQKLLRDLNL